MISKRQLLVVLGAVVVACGGSVAPIDPPDSTSNAASSSSSSSSGGGDTTPTPTPAPAPTEIPPRPPVVSLDVKAAISSATLGENCDNGGGAGDCEPGANGCGFTCQESNVQLFFETGAGTSVAVEIVSVTLHDAKSGAKVDSLAASEPQTWSASGKYGPWDEQLHPHSELRASYTLSAPSWQAIGKSGNTYSRTYRLRVVVKIDGVARTLESADLYREAAIPT